MSTVDEIMMQADADAIFDAAANVARWPEFLPHYRWVRVLEQTEEGVIVEMATRRGCIPVRWIALQTADPDRRLIDYRHLGGPTKGMTVTWHIEPLGDAVHVAIVHHLTLKTPVVRSAIGKLVVARFFIKDIAGRTLRGMKRHLEGGRQQCAAR